MLPSTPFVAVSRANTLQRSCSAVGSRYGNGNSGIWLSPLFIDMNLLGAHTMAITPAWRKTNEFISLDIDSKSEISFAGDNFSFTPIGLFGFISGPIALHAKVDKSIF